MTTNVEMIYTSVLEAGIDKYHAVIIGKAARVIAGLLSETDIVETLVSLHEYRSLTGHDYFAIEPANRLWRTETSRLSVSASFHTPDLLEEPYTKVHRLSSVNDKGFRVLHRSGIEARDRRTEAILAGLGLTEK